MIKTNDTNKTFRYKDLQITLHPDVYDPAEDTFLMIQALSQLPPKKTVLEIGTGCGIIALHCASQDSSVICTDINPYAVQLTRRNIQQNNQLLKGSIEVRQGNLFSPLQKDNKFDMIIFNPPYLPTTAKERINGWYNIATDGGTNGLKITQQFLHGCKNHLKKNGQIYFIFSSLSPRSTLESCLKKEGYSFKILATQRFEGEDLEVYCAAPAD